LLGWCGRRNAAGDGHRGVRGNDRRDGIRHLSHPGVLRAAARVERQPPSQSPWRDLHAGKLPGRGEHENRTNERSRMKFLLVPATLVLFGCATHLPQVDPDALPLAPESFKEGDGRWTLASPAEAHPRGE